MAAAEALDESEITSINRAETSAGPILRVEDISFRVRVRRRTVKRSGSES